MFIRISGVALAGLLAASVSTGAGAAPRFFPEPGPDRPFSAAVRVGDTVYVSGQIGLDAAGALPAGFAAQARNAMTNVAKELELAGAGMTDVFKCDVSLTDMANWPAFNAVYRTFFRPGAYPVRMATGVAALVKGAAVEVQCEAWRPAGR